MPGNSQAAKQGLSEARKLLNMCVGDQNKKVRSWTNHLQLRGLTHKRLLQYCTFVGIALFEAAPKVTTRIEWVNQTGHDISYIYIYTLKNKSNG